MQFHSRMILQLLPYLLRYRHDQRRLSILWEIELVDKDFGELIRCDKRFV